MSSAINRRRQRNGEPSHAPRSPPAPTDGNALGAYSVPGWTRTYTYAAASQLEPPRFSSRLTSPSVGGSVETYIGGGAGYDPLGNLPRLRHLHELSWDFDQLDRCRSVARARASTPDSCFNDPSTTVRSTMRDRDRHTIAVSDKVFRQVYDSPAALPGAHRWVTSERDLREIEKLLGIPECAIGAPLWVSGDRRDCASCGREINWLDIVASGVAQVHSKAMLTAVILGDRKYVNTEAPRAIADVSCVSCGTTFDNLRSFKCHNWAYAMPAVLEMIELAERGGELRDVEEIGEFGR